MALVLDESFLTGIPDNFATARAQTGTLAVSYNAGAQAVDLSNASAGQCMWDITSQPLLAAGEMEIDLEFVSDSSSQNYRHAGLWGLSSVGSITNGIRAVHHQNTTWCLEPFIGSTPWAGNVTWVEIKQGGDVFPFNSPGDRRLINLRWDLTTGAGVTRVAYEFRLDGKLILFFAASYGHLSLRPSVMLYQCAVRLHSIKVWDAPQAPLTPISSRGLPTPIARRICAPARALSPGGPVTVAFSDKVARRNIYQGGVGRIIGTVKEKSLPANVPLHRRVCLLEEKTRLLVAETWSDATTGNYVFERIDQTRTYTVMAYDHTGLYRAVIADRIVPEMLP